jgi:hypothetical protein
MASVARERAVRSGPHACEAVPSSGADGTLSWRRSELRRARVPTAARHGAAVGPYRLYQTAPAPRRGGTNTHPWMPAEPGAPRFLRMAMSKGCGGMFGPRPQRGRTFALRSRHCTISCTITDSGGRFAESLAFLHTQCDEASAELQWERSRFLAESAPVADRKAVAPRPICFEQVPILRITSRLR